MTILVYPQKHNLSLKIFSLSMMVLMFSLLATLTVSFKSSTI